MQFKCKKTFGLKLMQTMQYHEFKEQHLTKAGSTKRRHQIQSSKQNYPQKKKK